MLKLENLAKKFGELEILSNINLQLAQGKVAALVGESGSGKSTLLNMIAGLEAVEQGKIWIGDLDIGALTANEKNALRASKLGFVFQQFHLMPHLSAIENVMLPLLLNGLSRGESRERAMELLSKLGLTARLTALPNKLSGGEQQRVALARAVVHRPLLILADEPTGNLDPSHAQTALNLLLSTVKEFGSTLLIVTHSDKVAASADFSVRLQGGVLIESA